MRQWKIGLRIASVAVLVVPALLRCSSTSVVGTSAGQVGLTVQADGGSGRYDIGRLQLTALKLRPVDPDVQASLGGNPIGMLPFPINVNLTSTAPISVLVGAPPGASQPLTAGEYEVLEARLVEFSLIDNPPLMPGPACIQQVRTLVSGLPGAVTQPFAANASVVFSPPARFTVKRNGPTDLQLHIDVPGLIGLLESSFTCQTSMSCQPVPGGAPVPPPCISSFRTPTASQFAQFFTVESAS